MAVANRNPRFVHDEPCDYHDDPQDADTHCADEPTGYVGDIYYACREHFDRMADWLESDVED